MTPTIALPSAAPHIPPPPPHHPHPPPPGFQVKLAYRKATLRVHPDRVVTLDLEKRFIGEKK